MCMYDFEKCKDLHATVYLGGIPRPQTVKLYLLFVFSDIHPYHLQRWVGVRPTNPHIDDTVLLGTLLYVYR